MKMKIEIEAYESGGVWNARYCTDGVDGHLTEAFESEYDAIRAALDMVGEELPL